MEKCKHESFVCEVMVNRIEDVGRFHADVRVVCDQCKTPFRFIGLPAGLDYNSPTVSVDATEARMPIAPKGEVLSELEGGPVGFSIRKTDGSEVAAMREAIRAAYWHLDTYGIVSGDDRQKAKQDRVFDLLRPFVK